jgi:hypothetical protein
MLYGTWAGWHSSVSFSNHTLDHGRFIPFIAFILNKRWRNELNYANKMWRMGLIQSFQRAEPKKHQLWLAFGGNEWAK